ncbi:hypothetical protein RYZ27_04990 [Hyphomonas sp. FCG-A18]|uniref:hypothetical protein n=1 Tax=Hyphomonas sp. FCG-A18 TaxID=3080019 RepID=UPI002B2AA668|nr:hypothetical protein RYZ27_04990 [Hyphomonas sp. FCG-A18]
MFKRPPLSSANQLVNGSVALTLLFMAAACGNNTERPDTQPENGIETPEPYTEPTPITEGLVLPAVWTSRNLETPITSVAVAGGPGSTIAVSYSDGSMQLLNFEGERITDPSPLNVRQLGNGQYTLIAGTPLTVFPGIDIDGQLKAYLHGGALEAPLEYELSVETSGRIEGLCSGRPMDESDGVMRLAFWTVGAQSQLQSGRVVEIGDALVFLADEPVDAARPITACVLEPTGATVFAEPVTKAIGLERNGKQHIITLDTAGGVTLIGPEGENTPITLRDGISVRVPGNIESFAGTGDARGGGYPGGLIVLGGAISTSEHRAVLVDPSELTLAPLGVPIVSGQD